MPTTTIETQVTDPRFHRRVAKDLTFWWRRHGVEPAHVVTRFVPGSADRIYLGPYAMAHSTDGRHVPFAFVVCVMAQDREADFRTACARQIRRSLGPEIPPDRVFIAIEPTNPANHFTPADDWGAEEDPA